jgi:hypothetical protein
LKIQKDLRIASNTTLTIGMISSYNIKS